MDTVNGPHCGVLGSTLTPSVLRIGLSLKPNPHFPLKTQSLRNRGSSPPSSHCEVRNTADKAPCCVFGSAFLPLHRIPDDDVTLQNIAERAGEVWLYAQTAECQGIPATNVCSSAGHNWIKYRVKSRTSCSRKHSITTLCDSNRQFYVESEWK